MAAAASSSSFARPTDRLVIDRTSEKRAAPEDSITEPEVKRIELIEWDTLYMSIASLIDENMQGEDEFNAEDIAGMSRNSTSSV